MIGRRTVAAREAFRPRLRSSHPGRNCWRVERAHRFYCVQDGADISGWSGRRCSARAARCGFSAGTLCDVDLLPGRPRRTRRPARRVARLRRRAAASSLLPSYLGLCRALHARARSVVAVASRVADSSTSGSASTTVIPRRLPPSESRCGGRSAGLLRRHHLTGHRWDTCAHRVESRRARPPLGEAYGPYHEIQAMVRHRSRPALACWPATAGARSARSACRRRPAPPTTYGRPTSLPISPTSTLPSPASFPASDGQPADPRVRDAVSGFNPRGEVDDSASQARELHQ